MKLPTAFALLAAIALNSCGKDPSPSTSSTSGQTANVSPGTPPAENGTPAAPPAPHGPGSPVKPPAPPSVPGTPDGAYCPVVELAGTYKVNSVECNTDGRSDKVDTSAVPSAYVVVAQGNTSGTLSLSVGAKILTLTFPRNPDTWLDFQKNGTQCSDGAAKSLTQRCPGAKDSTCEYSLTARGGKVQGVFYRLSGTHVYECHSDLSLVAPARQQ